MPTMTGLELYARLIESGHRIPTILITAHPDEDARAQALAQGIFYYLAKPFDDNELAGCVQKAIEGGRPAGSS
jgi:FixJ family two-component response regulator